MAGNITTTTAAVFIPALWSIETLRATEAALVAATLVKRYDSQVKDRGQALHIPNVSNLTANAKTVNTDVTNQVVTETDTTLTINKWYEASFKVEDMAEVQSAYDLRSEYTSKAGYAIAKQVDSDVLAQYANFTNAAVGTYGAALADTAIVAAIQKLDEANMPIDNRAMIIAPSGKADIMKIDKFVRADYLGNYQEATPVRKGPNSRYLWGDIYGVPVYYTTNVPKTVASPTQTHNMLIHKEAIALALQQAPRMQAAYWLPSLAWQVVVDTIYGVTTLRADGGVEIKS